MPQVTEMFQVLAIQVQVQVQPRLQVQVQLRVLHWQVQVRVPSTQLNFKYNVSATQRHQSTLHFKIIR